LELRVHAGVGKSVVGMPPTTEPVQTAATRGQALGLVFIAATVIVVAAFMYMQRPTESQVAPKTAESAQDAALPGFRADAWFLPDDELLGFVEIAGGPFRMGSDPSVDPLAYDNERWSTSIPQTEVELPTFYIGRYEVTVAQFRAFAADAGFAADETSLSGLPDHPVTFVSWPDALAYCRWLDEALRESPETPASLRRLLESGWHVTLPTEAQWEKAARGSDARIFPWGNEPRRDRANYRGSGTTSVGSFACPECPFGLSDMSGNAWELTQSPYRPYPYRAVLTDINLEADALWVMRGGSFGDPEQNIRTATRGGADPGARRGFIGFRVVLTMN
jgi:formylglycine-generating enzyme required for sulfatase activity